MRVHIERDYLRQSHRVYVVRDGSPATAAFLDANMVCWTEIAEGEDPPVFLELPAGMLEAIVAEASDVLPPSGATVRHLDDAMNVRDRLLSLVEDIARPASGETEVRDADA